MAIKNRFPSNDEYGGMKLNTGIPTDSQKNGDVIRKIYKSRLTSGKTVSICSSEYSSMSGCIRQGLGAEITVWVIFGIMALLLFLPIISGMISKSLNEATLPPIQEAAVFIPIIILIIKILIAYKNRSEINHADCRTEALKIQEKYSCTDIGNDTFYYIVINGVWVNVNVDIYKNVGIGDTIACMLMKTGSRIYFAASDHVIL